MLKIVTPKEYKIQVESIKEVIVDFSKAGITRRAFEKMSFIQKASIVAEFGIEEKGNFKQITDIEVMGKVE